MKTFNPEHYVPVLRWKEAERWALAHACKSEFTNITPFIELVPENFEQSEKNLSLEIAMYSIAGQLAQTWNESPIFIDFTSLPPHLARHSGQCLSILSDYSRCMGFTIVPVFGIKGDNSYNLAVCNLVHRNNQGGCLRIKVGDLQSDAIEIFIKNQLSNLGLPENEIDLFIDCESINGSSSTYYKIYQLIPNSEQWRNIIVSGGAFPKDLASFRKNDEHSIPRLEWALWREHLKRTLDKNCRIMTYSDYTIQFARYVPKRIGQMHYSASIRYTNEDNWVVLRGEDVFKKGGQGFKQYPDLAAVLCDSSYYSGSSYSDGDEYIKQISLQSNETGAATQWLQAGINHHIVFASRQISELISLTQTSQSVARDCF